MYDAKKPISMNAAASTDVTEDGSNIEKDMCSRLKPPVKFNAMASFFALLVVTTIRIATFWQ